MATGYVAEISVSGAAARWAGYSYEDAASMDNDTACSPETVCVPRRYSLLTLPRTTSLLWLEQPGARSGIHRYHASARSPHNT
jgi:hypothetical protein